MEDPRIIGIGEFIRSILVRHHQPLTFLRESMEHAILEEWDRIISPIIADPTLISKFTSPSRYQRHVVFRCDEFEIVIIAWLPSQQTSIHGHPSGGCLFRVLVGRLSEQLFPEDGSSLCIRAYTAEDSFGYIDDRAGKHQVICVSDEPTISLHIYSPPFS